MIMSNWKCDPTAVAMAMAVCNHLALQTAIAASEKKQKMLFTQPDFYPSSVVMPSVDAAISD